MKLLHLALYIVKIVPDTVLIYWPLQRQRSYRYIPIKKIQLNNKFKVLHVHVYHSIKVPMDKRKGVSIHTIKNTESTNVRKKQKKTNKSKKTQQTTRRKTKISDDQQP